MYPLTSLVVCKADRVSLSKGRISSEAVRVSVTSRLEMMASSVDWSYVGIATLHNPARSASMSRLDGSELVCDMFCGNL
jgi:hypothetical protein